MAKRQPSPEGLGGPSRKTTRPPRPAVGAPEARHSYLPFTHLFNNNPPFQQPPPLQSINHLGTLTEVVEKTSLPKATITGSNLQTPTNFGILKKLHE